MKKGLLAIMLLSPFIPCSLLAQTVWTGPTISFSKAAGANFNLPANQDRITPTTWLTRGATEGIFNIASEAGYTRHTSPENTEWATGSLANYATLNYQPWYNWAAASPPSTVGVQAVLHLIAEDIYIGITFTSWGSGAGGGGSFSYTRTTPGNTIPAPVKLASFTAAKKNNAVQLAWTTVAEENTSLFSIERSADGKEFSAIAAVAANGNSSDAIDYSYTDANPLTANFYRLKTIDRDGTFSYSNVISFKTGRKTSFEVYPVPATRTVNIQLAVPERTVLQVVDISGRLVKCITVPEGENSFTIDIGHLLKGTYFLRAGTGSRMIIKE